MTFLSSSGLRLRLAALMADATVFMDCRRVFMGVNVGGNRCDG